MSKELQMKSMEAVRAHDESFCFVEEENQSERTSGWKHIYNLHPGGCLPNAGDWSILCLAALEQKDFTARSLSSLSSREWIAYKLTLTVHGTRLQLVQ